MYTLMAVDPGETIGIVIVLTTGISGVSIRTSLQTSIPKRKSGLPNWTDYADQLYELIDTYKVEALVQEDFRLYGTRAMSQVGSRMLTSEVLAVTEYVALDSDLKVARVSASLKGRWPEARLKAKHPLYFTLQQPHAGDAFLIALGFIEKLEKIDILRKEV